MAHRGGSNWAPNLGHENTLAAFRQAVSLGFRYVETDLQASADGHLFCLHDPTLERMTGAPGRVVDHTAAQLASLAVGGSEPLPRFDDVVEALPDTRFNVDLKTPEAVEPLVRAIADHHLQDRILVDSFSQQRISRFRALTRGRIPTAMAPVGTAWTAFVPLLPMIVNSPATAVQVPVTQRAGRFTIPVVTRALIERAHQAGKVVHVWTVDDPAVMRHLIDLGVDGIITDRPDLLKDVLVSRDLWDGA
jgi:glycerophosphoryl diester phosphodiesterase